MNTSNISIVVQLNHTYPLSKKSSSLSSIWARSNQRSCVIWITLTFCVWHMLTFSKYLPLADRAHPPVAGQPWVYALWMVSYEEKKVNVHPCFQIYKYGSSHSRNFSLHLSFPHSLQYVPNNNNHEQSFV